MAVVVYALSPGLWLVLPALVLAGVGFMAASTAATTRLLLTVPAAQHGRFMAIWSALFLGFRPLASLADGAIASANVRVAAAVMALPTLAVALWLLARPPAGTVAGTVAATD